MVEDQREGKDTVGYSMGDQSKDWVREVDAEVDADGRRPKMKIAFLFLLKPTLRLINRFEDQTSFGEQDAFIQPFARDRRLKEDLASGDQPKVG